MLGRNHKHNSTWYIYCNWSHVKRRLTSFLYFKLGSILRSRGEGWKLKMLLVWSESEALDTRFFFLSLSLIVVTPANRRLWRDKSLRWNKNKPNRWQVPVDKSTAMTIIVVILTSALISYYSLSFGSISPPHKPCVYIYYNWLCSGISTLHSAKLNKNPLLEISSSSAVSDSQWFNHDSL